VIWPGVVQIGCPKCQTHYALDDRLVDPGGVPVQCTRCGHIFTAYRPGETAPPPAPGAPKPRAQASGYPDPPPPAPGSQTQVFGGPPAARTAPPGAAPTPSFGTTGPAPAPGSQTQVFGATPAVPAPPAGGQTQVFGAVGGAPPSPPRAPAPAGSTQVFGGPQPGASSPAPTAPPADAGAQTRVFGTGIAAPPPPSSTSSTQVFGGAAGSIPSAPRSSAAAGSTQVFGAAGPASPPAPSAPPATGSTQVFGAAGAAAPPAPRAPVPAAGPQAFTGASGGPPAAPRAPAPAAAPAPAGATQVFGAQAPPAPASPPASRAPAQPPGPPPPGRAPSAVDPSMAQTLAFGGRGPEADAAIAQTVSMPAPPPAAPAARARSGGVSLPPEDPGLNAPPLPGLAMPRRDSRTLSRPDAAELALRRQYQQRNRLALGGLAALVVVVAAAFGVRALLSGTRGAPAEAVVEQEAAFALLRKDDAIARAQAIPRLQALVTAYPRYVEARAALALALLLELDDRRAAIQRYTHEAEGLVTQRARLEAERPGPDWRVLANRLVDRITVLKAKSDPLIEDAKGVQTQANAAYGAMMKLPAEQPAERLARTRTEAMFNAIDGRDQAIALAERYRQAGGQDGWADVAFAEYALNTRVPPETANQALEALRALQQRDTTFLRAYVLGGRLALQGKRWDLAAGQLEAALALNPRHALAQALSEDARAEH